MIQAIRKLRRGYLRGERRVADFLHRRCAALPPGQRPALTAVGVGLLMGVNLYIWAAAFYKMGQESMYGYDECTLHSDQSSLSSESGGKRLRRLKDFFEKYGEEGSVITDTVYLDNSNDLSAE